MAPSRKERIDVTGIGQEIDGKNGLGTPRCTSSAHA
jgi:hypothetical protein